MLAHCETRILKSLQIWEQAYIDSKLGQTSLVYAHFLIEIERACSYFYPYITSNLNAIVSL